jgi:hypothetical protein
MEKLPMEMMYLILSFLKPIDLCKTRLISKAMRSIVDNESVWKEIVQRVLKLNVSSSEKESNETWKEFYIRMSE